MTVLQRYADLRAQFADAATVTTLTSGYTQPAVGGTVAVAIGSAAAMTPLWPPVTTPNRIWQKSVYIEGGGFYTVASVTSGTAAVLQSLGLPGDVAPGTSVSTPASVRVVQDDGASSWPEPWTGAPATSLRRLRANGFALSLQASSVGGHIWTAATASGSLLDVNTLPSGDALFPMLVTCNGGASSGLTEPYLWYLSQNTDSARLPGPDGTPAAADCPQVLSITQLSNLHSGTVVIDVNASAMRRLWPFNGGAPPLVANPPFYPTVDAPTVFATLFRGMQIYCLRRSDGAYQWANLIPAPLS